MVQHVCFVTADPAKRQPKFLEKVLGEAVNSQQDPLLYNLYYLLYKSGNLLSSESDENGYLVGVPA